MHKIYKLKKETVIRAMIVYICTFKKRKTFSLGYLNTYILIFPN